MENIPTNTIPVHTISLNNTRNSSAGEERFEAICRFVDILTPQEIKGLTKFYHETWTIGEMLNYSELDPKCIYIDGMSYRMIFKSHSLEWETYPVETKLHMSFRYKFQKFAYVLVSLKETD